MRAFVCAYRNTHTNTHTLHYTLIFYDNKHILITIYKWYVKKIFGICSQLARLTGVFKLDTLLELVECPQCQLQPALCATTSEAKRMGFALRLELACHKCGYVFGNTYSSPELPSNKKPSPFVINDTMTLLFNCERYMFDVQWTLVMLLALCAFVVPTCMHSHFLILYSFCDNFIKTMYHISMKFL